MLFPFLLRPTGTATVILLLAFGFVVRPACTQMGRNQETTGAPARAASGSAPNSAQTASEAAASEMRADILMARHQYVAAIQVYEALPPSSAPLLNKLGIAYEKMRLYPQAKLSFQRAVAMNPKFSGPENNLGTVFYAEGDYHRAEQHYKRALKIDPHNASIYNNLGTLYFMRRKIHKGVEAFQQAQSLDPEIFRRNAENRIQTEGSKESRALINFYLAETCAQAGMNSAALEYLRQAINAGFHDQAKLREDGHFAVLRQTPEFKTLMLETEHPGPGVQSIQ
jgi:tetratricopeptide (TPR) repeat protein